MGCGGANVRTVVIIAPLLAGLLMLLGAALLADAGLPLMAVMVLVADGVLLALVVRSLRRKARRSRRSRRPSAFAQQPGRSQRASAIRLDVFRHGRPIGGIVCAGVWSGQRLETLSLDALLDLGAGIEAADTVSLALLVRYLDSAHPGWRHTPEGDIHGRSEWPRSGRPGPDLSDARLAERRAALRLLGLREGASPAEICEAHRRLIKRVHPDVGGSASLTAEVNLARAVLLSQDGSRRNA